MLRRQTSTSPVTYVDVAVRAVVTGYQPEELAGGIAQTDSRVILSPLEIEAAAWPGPPRKGDKAVIQGRVRNVEAVHVRRIGEQAVRIELRVLG